MGAHTQSESETDLDAACPTAAANTDGMAEAVVDQPYQVSS
jgi:hypothetical protein